MPLSAYLCLMHLTALFSLIKFSPTCKFMCLLHIVALRLAHTDCPLCSEGLRGKSKYFSSDYANGGEHGRVLNKLDLCVVKFCSRKQRCSFWRPGGVEDLVILVDL